MRAQSISDAHGLPRPARQLTRLVFLSHPYAWASQFHGNPAAAAKPRYGGFTGAQLVAMEQQVSRRWPEEIRRLGPDDALVVNGFPWGGATVLADDGPGAPVLRAARERLGDRFLLTCSEPGEAYGRQIVEQFSARGYALNPASLASEGWGQSFEGCLPRWAGGMAAGIGIPRGIPMRYELTFPDAPFAMTGRFLRRIAIGGTDVSLYLFVAADGRPFGIFFPGIVRDTEPTRFALCSVAPGRVEFTTKRGEPVELLPQDGTTAVPLHVDGRGDPVYIWSRGLGLEEFVASLAVAPGHGRGGSSD